MEYKILERSKLEVVEEYLKIEKSIADIIYVRPVPNSVIENCKISHEKMISDWDERYKKISPIKNWNYYVTYLKALEKEEYEVCSKFKIID